MNSTDERIEAATRDVARAVSHTADWIIPTDQITAVLRRLVDEAVRDVVEPLAQAMDRYDAATRIVREANKQRNMALNELFKLATIRQRERKITTVRECDGSDPSCGGCSNCREGK